jgi:hypothetical protein
MPAVYVILGWLLGLLSPQIVDLIQRPYRRRLIRHSLFIELAELRPRLAMLAYLILSQSGDVDREFVVWTQSMLGTTKNPRSKMTIAEGLKVFLNFDDQQLKQIFQASANPTANTNFPKITLPFLSSQIPTLTLFSSEFQRLALTVLADINTLNEHLDFLNFNFKKTFDAGLTTSNHQMIITNMQIARLSVAQIARNTCDRVTQLLALSK